MNWTLTHRIAAGVAFLYAFVLYVLTVSPTVSFWDPGERIAVSYGLQIPHPPGAPVYMLVGRLFSMFMPVDMVALSINMISVISSALTVMLTYLIIVRLVREWKEDRSLWGMPDHIVAIAGGLIGAFSIAVAMSFWFDALEAETYAFSTFLAALCVWLALKWVEQARLQDAQLAGGRVHVFGSGAERWLIVIAYLYGLASGVHLLSLLSIFFVALIVYFQHFERPEWDQRRRVFGLIAAGAVSSVGFLLIYPGLIQYLPALAESSGAPGMFLVAFFALVAIGIYYTHRKRLRVANLVMMCVAVVMIGYSSYALILVRSQVNPPIDQNAPESVEALISYLKREQYGQTPLVRGNTFDNRLGRIDTQRETLFPRRHSPDPTHWREYERYNSDFSFFWQYQVGHMYLRYLMWNFSGRASDVQGAPALPSFQEAAHLYPMDSPSQRAARTNYFAIPLLLGLIGMAYHFYRDWRRAFAVLTLFFVTGLGIIIYLNQTPFQPRERDYSYIINFFAFSIWVGIGAAGLMELAMDAARRRGAAAMKAATVAVAVLLFIGAPLNMLVQNYGKSDRSGNYVARDYAYNLLMSVAPNAVLFTNGDNDTFPLWYLQEVEGIRRDVRVANLSLMNTGWYLHQLKNQWSRDSAPLPMSMTDQQIRQITVVPWEPRTFELPVDVDAVRRQVAAGEGVSELPGQLPEIESPMRWEVPGRPFRQDLNIAWVSDLAVIDIVRTNAQQGWQRPIYFAVTVSPDNMADLQQFFQMEGQAFRVVPVRHDDPYDLGRVVPGITDERLLSFRFTNLDNDRVYFDENIRRMVDNYRSVFSHAAQSLAEQGERERAQRLLNTIMERVPFETVPGDVRSYVFLSRAFQAVGDRDAVVSLLQRVEPVVLSRLETARTQREMQLAIQYMQFVQATYMEAGAFEEAAAFGNRIADELGDDAYRQSADELRRLYQQRRPPEPPEEVLP
jgi:hypothetical protein